MNQRRVSPLFIYVPAAILTAAPAAIRLALEAKIGQLPTFVTFYPAVISSALIGGNSPGLLATALGTLTATWFLQTSGSLIVANLKRRDLALPGDPYGRDEAA